MLKTMRRNKELYRQPYWQIADQVQNWSRSIPRRYPVTRTLLADFVMPGLPTLRTRTARIETEIEAARLSLALHIYKNNHGAFPDKLDPLAPEIIKTIPVDPISGKPFEYRKDGAYFVISSVWLKEKAEKAKQQPIKNLPPQNKK